MKKLLTLTLTIFACCTFFSTLNASAATIDNSQQVDVTYEGRYAAVYFDAATNQYYMDKYCLTGSDCQPTTTGTGEVVYLPNTNGASQWTTHEQTTNTYNYMLVYQVDASALAANQQLNFMVDNGNGEYYPLVVPGQSGNPANGTFYIGVVAEYDKTTRSSTYTDSPIYSFYRDADGNLQAFNLNGDAVHNGNNYVFNYEVVAYLGALGTTGAPNMKFNFNHDEVINLTDTVVNDYIASTTPSNGNTTDDTNTSISSESDNTKVVNGPANANASAMIITSAIAFAGSAALLRKRK